MICVAPFAPTAVDAAVNVIVDPAGARSGTFSHADPAKTRIATTRTDHRELRVIMESVNILMSMQLQRQAEMMRRRESGYAMAALLVAIAIMAVMLTAAMPVYKQMAQREKEDELVFRGTQYVHAIGLFQRKYMNAFPPNVDVLVEQRFLRKKFKDPITNDDFQPLGAGQVVPGSLQDRVVNGPGQLNTQPPPGTSGRGAASSTGRGAASSTGRGATTTGGSPASPG